MYVKLKEWVISQQNIIDEITAKSCSQFFDELNDFENLSYDLEKSHLESYNLVKNIDLCYDRVTTPLSYTLWYHPRRINTFLSYFLKNISSFSGESIQVFDLGAGTGAVQWAIGIVLCGMKYLNMKTPLINFVNIDTSPFMLEFNKKYLWKNFCEKYPMIEGTIIPEYEVNSWNNYHDLMNKNTIISSSYLFDSSENQEDIKKDFMKIVETYRPSSLLILTSQEKFSLISKMLRTFKELGYVSNSQKEDLLFDNELKHINNLRKNIYAENTNVKALSRDSTWLDPSYKGISLSKEQTEIALDLSSKPIPEISLFESPLRIIKDIKLNSKQKASAEHSDLPSVIIGPAGCGKSIVIAEKIKNTAKNHSFDPKLKILVTTFNKALVSQLFDWLKQHLCDHGTITKEINNVMNFYFAGSNKPNIRILHFDILPFRIGEIKFDGMVDELNQRKILIEIIEETIKKRKINPKKFTNILNPTFLIEEFHRVIYGLEIGVKNGMQSYNSVIRVGRGNNPTLRKNSDRRMLVFEIIRKYADYLYSNKIPDFTMRRFKLKNKLLKLPQSEKFDYVFVDEFQDCTKADFRIFTLLLNNPNHLCIAGDIAQAVHIGPSANIPRFEEMKRRRTHQLEGSYRLPVRISEAIKPISSAIKSRFQEKVGLNVITPYKGSPPGTRPIIAYSTTEQNMAKKIASVHQRYKIFDLNKITILENDRKLSDLLNNFGLISESDTVLRLKGLEKRFVVWSTRMPIEFIGELYEFTYTILTRTSCLLVIALFEDCKDYYYEILGKLRRDRLILWDNETEKNFNRFTINKGVEIQVDET